MATYRRRPAPCSGCGDVVLIAEGTIPRLFGLDLKRRSKVWLEHADPGPSGEVHDPVDADCRRPRVT